MVDASLEEIEENLEFDLLSNDVDEDWIIQEADEG